MALTAARVTVGGLPYRVYGGKKHTVTDLTFDSSYPAGGEAVTPANLNLNKIDRVENIEITTVGGTVNVANVTFDAANSKLIVYDETPAEVTDTATLATLVVRVTAEGY